MNKVEVRAASRLHLGLVDLGGATLRRYGGAGISIDRFDTSVIGQASTKLRVSAEPNVLDRRTEADIFSALQRMYAANSKATAHVHVKSCAQRHIGLGSKTSLVLAALRSAALATNCVFAKDELISLSGRGGASGSGVHLFWHGGLVVDAGQPRSTTGWLPSSAAPPKTLPLLSVAQRFPSEWAVHLFLPSGGKVFSRDEELAFFSANTPISQQEVLSTLAAIYHGVVPAVAECDLQLLAESLDQIRKVGFKKREIDAQGSAKSLINFLSKELRLPVGMSSLGPLVYLIAKTDDEFVRAFLSASAKRFAANYLGCFKVPLEGHQIYVHSAPVTA